VAVIEANIATFWRLYGSAVPGVERMPRDDVDAYLGPWAFGLLNPVAGVRLRGADADAAIAEILGRAEARGSDQWWFGGPGDEPADLGDRLVAAGLTAHAPSPGMARSLEAWTPPVAPPDLEVVAVGEAEYGEYVDVLVESFGFAADLRDTFAPVLGAMAFAPGTPMRNFLGRLGGRPVACSTLLLADGVAGLWNVGTTAPARGRGAGTALTAAAMAAGARAGARTAVLIATSLGAPVYRAMGFETVCEMPLWSRL
jgi:ribosomal protein S18 acetylase RimI-like enzyme